MTFDLSGTADECGGDFCASDHQLVALGNAQVPADVLAREGCVLWHPGVETLIRLRLVRYARHCKQVQIDVVGEPYPLGGCPAGRPSLPCSREREYMVDLDLTGFFTREGDRCPGVGVVQCAGLDLAAAASGFVDDILELSGQHIIAGVAPVVRAWTVVVVSPRLSE